PGWATRGLPQRPVDISITSAHNQVCGTNWLPRRPEMRTQALDRIRFVTRHFNDLQGLRYWVPLGLVTLSIGGTTYVRHPQVVILRAVLFVGAFAMALGARRYYSHTFGEVEPQEVSPAREVLTLSIYSPAGPISRLGGFQRMPPMMRSVMIPLGLAAFLFTWFLATPPALLLDDDESLIQPPWTTWQADLSLLNGTWPSEFHWLTHSTRKAVGGQLIYALLGSCFVGIWLGRERRLSQSYYLAFGALMLGLSALGISLGHFYRDDVDRGRLVAFLLSAVTHLWVTVLL